MANVKRLQQYLKCTCELLSDLSYLEEKEMLKVYQDIVPDIKREDFNTEFIDCEIDEAAGRVTYRFRCKVCDLVHERTMDIETDYLYIGSCPSEEENSFKQYTSHQLCIALIRQLVNTFGAPPQGAELKPKYEAGEDGYEVVCYFNTRYPMSMAYAYMLEAELPKRWSATAILTLERLTGRPYKK